MLSNFFYILFKMLKICYLKKDNSENYFEKEKLLNLSNLLFRKKMNAVTPIVFVFIKEYSKKKILGSQYPLPNPTPYFALYFSFI